MTKNIKSNVFTLIIVNIRFFYFTSKFKVIFLIPVLFLFLFSSCFLLIKIFSSFFISSSEVVFDYYLSKTLLELLASYVRSMVSGSKMMSVIYLSTYSFFLYLYLSFLYYFLYFYSLRMLIFSLYSFYF